MLADSVARRILAYGDPPGDLCPESALSELVSTKDLYGQEPANLAAYDASKLRVCKGDTRPKPACALLPEEAACYLREFRTCIERPDMDTEGDDMPTPYWDPVLRNSRTLRHQLFRRLLALGIAGAHRQRKASASLFFVHKKDGNIRMVIDARYTNACHRRPPPTVLGSGSAIASMDLSDFVLDMGSFGGTATFSSHQSDSDVKDAFYQYDVHELGSWFCLELVDAEQFDITHCWCDVAMDWVRTQPGQQVWLAIDAMCMGWSWATFFCQAGTTWFASRAAPGGHDQLLLERRPAPIIKPGFPVLSVYIDNYLAFAGTRDDAVQAANRFATECAKSEVTLHADHVGVVILEGLGLKFHGDEKTLRHTPRRIWRFSLASTALLRRRRWTWKILQIWLGHAVCIACLCRPLLAIL